MSPSSLAEALAERLLERFPPSRTYDRTALAEAGGTGAPPLPRTVRHFLERMMTRRVEIERERLRVLRQPWLDHEHDEVRQAEEALLEAVHQHVRIPQAAWERVLRHACARVAAHLVRPVPTLEDFVFGAGAPRADGDPQPADGGDGPDLLPARVVRRRLSYFAAYPYLRETINAYVEQRDVASFQREQLGALLRRVDERMCDGHDTESWLRLLQPLFAFGRAAHPNHDGLATELLETFFEEKSAEAPLHRLRAARREHGLAVLSPSALREVLASDAQARAQPEQREAATPPAKKPAPRSPEGPETKAGRAERAPEEERAEDARTKAASDADLEPTPSAHDGPAAASEEPASEPAPAEEDASDAPLWKRFLSPSGPAEATRGQGREAPSRNAGAAEHEGSGGASRPRWQEFSGATAEGRAPREEEGAPAEHASSPPAGAAPPEQTGLALRALEDAVLGNAAEQRTRFVRELFGGSQEEYERVLRRLREAEGWPTATKVIAQDVFRAHGVNIYSDPARSFTNAVEAHFQ